MNACFFFFSNRSTTIKSSTPYSPRLGKLFFDSQILVWHLEMTNWSEHQAASIIHIQFSYPAAFLQSMKLRTVSWAPCAEHRLTSFLLPSAPHSFSVRMPSYHRSNFQNSSKSISSKIKNCNDSYWTTYNFYHNFSCEMIKSVLREFVFSLPQKYRRRNFQTESRCTDMKRKRMEKKVKRGTKK